MRQRLPWGVYLALWSFSALLAVSWLRLWSTTPPYTEWLGPYPITLWDWCKELAGVAPEHLFRTRSYWPDNIRTTLLILVAGGALGAAARWVRRQPSETKDDEMNINLS